MAAGSVTSSEVAGVSIVLEAVDEAVDTALVVRPTVPERPTIDAMNRGLVSHLRVLMAEELGFDEDPAVQALFREGYRVLDLTRRPTEQSTLFIAYQYMRDVGSLTRRFADVYRATRKQDQDDG
ncbi:hypothetical protein [Streptomyces sp. NPDC017941]|uniref:hypothetical protein n=1 Tax=Streptomyces sp. NPDC017941 TaxID=3365018 RepID=UPI00378CFA79